MASAGWHVQQKASCLNFDTAINLCSVLFQSFKRSTFKNNLYFELQTQAFTLFFRLYLAPIHFDKDAEQDQATVPRAKLSTGQCSQSCRRENAQ